MFIVIPELIIVIGLIEFNPPSWPRGWPVPILFDKGIHN